MGRRRPSPTAAPASRRAPRAPSPPSARATRPAAPPPPGQDITAMLGSIRATVPSPLPGTGGTNETIPDSTGAGSYRLRPANLCLPNTAPLAAISANPSEGFKPLLVHFDASASSDAD